MAQASPAEKQPIQTYGDVLLVDDDLLLNQKNSWAISVGSQINHNFYSDTSLELSTSHHINEYVNNFFLFRYHSVKKKPLYDYYKKIDPQFDFEKYAPIPTFDFGYFFELTALSSRINLFSMKSLPLNLNLIFGGVFSQYENSLSFTSFATGFNLKLKLTEQNGVLFNNEVSWTAADSSFKNNLSLGWVHWYE